MFHRNSGIISEADPEHPAMHLHHFQLMYVGGYNTTSLTYGLINQTTTTALNWYLYAWSSSTAVSVDTGIPRTTGMFTITICPYLTSNSPSMAVYLNKSATPSACMYVGAVYDFTPILRLRTSDANQKWLGCDLIYATCPRNYQ